MTACMAATHVHSMACRLVKPSHTQNSNYDFVFAPKPVVLGGDCDLHRNLLWFLFIEWMLPVRLLSNVIFSGCLVHFVSVYWCALVRSCADRLMLSIQLAEISVHDKSAAQ